MSQAADFNDEHNDYAHDEYRPRRAFCKEDLRQYRQLCGEIAELEAEKEATAAGLLPSSWPVGRVAGGRLPDCVADEAQRLWHLSCLLAERLNRLIELREAIEQAISGLLPDERRLLRLYYIEGRGAGEVAEALQYSERHFWRRHKKALQKLFDMPALPNADRQAPQSFLPNPAV